VLLHVNSPFECLVALSF